MSIASGLIKIGGGKLGKKAAVLAAKQFAALKSKKGVAGFVAGQFGDIYPKLTGFGGEPLLKNVPIANRVPYLKDISPLDIGLGTAAAIIGPEALLAYTLSDVVGYGAGQLLTGLTTKSVSTGIPEINIGKDYPGFAGVSTQATLKEKIVNAEDEVAKALFGARSIDQAISQLEATGQRQTFEVFDQYFAPKLNQLRREKDIIEETLKTKQAFLAGLQLPKIELPNLNLGGVLGGIATAKAEVMSPLTPEFSELTQIIEKSKKQRSKISEAVKAWASGSPGFEVLLKQTEPGRNVTAAIEEEAGFAGELTSIAERLLPLATLASGIVLAKQQQEAVAQLRSVFAPKKNNKKSKWRR